MKKRRVLTFLLATSMVVSGCPVSAMAAEVSPEEIAVEAPAVEAEEAPVSVEVEEAEEIEDAAEETAVGEQKQPEAVDGYYYVYCSMSWAQYWQNEGVYLADGSTMDQAGTETDSHSESDLGAFDAVSRATANHGPARSSYQCTMYLYDTDGNPYQYTGENGNVQIKKVDGVSKIYVDDVEKGTYDHSINYGPAYVPVKVAVDDWATFNQEFDGKWLANGDTYSGGTSSEGQVTVIKDEVVAVSEDTDGLKTYNADTNSFSAGASSDSTTVGKVVDSSKITIGDVRYNSGYGDYIRVDLTGDAYGDLGAHMYAVTWDYYGDDPTYSNKIASYGTKFAADNWMHSRNGIQLGLTKSLRAAETYGYYRITIHATGYQDYSFDIYAPSDSNEKIAMDSVNLGGVHYYYADLSGKDLSSVTMTATLADGDPFTCSPSAMTQIGDTGIYYIVDADESALSGTLYGTKPVAYSALYRSLGVTGASAEDYDVITSATNYTSRHAGDITPLAVWGTDGDSKYISGVNVAATVAAESVEDYVEAAITRAAGKTLTSGQEQLLEVTLNEDATTAPVEKTVEIDTAAYAYSCRYGDGEFTISMKTDGDYVWNDYYNALYAATISDGTNTAGAVHWIDLYGENATQGAHYNKVEIAVNNGTADASNEATVNRFASMWNTQKDELKAGTYTVTLYAQGYQSVSAQVQVKESYGESVTAALSEDQKTVSLEGMDGLTNPTVTVTRTEGSGRNAVTYTYADAVAPVNGTVTLNDTPVIGGTYTVTVNSDNYAPYSTTIAYAENLKNAVVTVADVTYNGKAQTPEVTVVSTGRTLTEGTDYTVAYSNNTNAGTATVTVTGIGNYTGTATKNFSIAKAAQSISGVISSYTQTYSASGSFTLGAKATAGSVSYKVTSGADVVSVDAAGKVTFKKAGTAVITITTTAADYETATSTVTVKVNKGIQKITTSKATRTYKKSALKKGKKKFNISAKTTSGGGKVTYKVASKKAKKYISVTKKGKVTIKKNTPKGTYKITVKAAGNDKYNAATKTIKIKVK